MWIWPVWKFWTFTPWGWLAAIAWNVGEIFHIAAFRPFTPRWFELIMDRKGKLVLPKDGEE